LVADFSIDETENVSSSAVFYYLFIDIIYWDEESVLVHFARAVPQRLKPALVVPAGCLG
jgi:uncharacterized membrane protein (UPF0127 family)